MKRVASWHARGLKVGFANGCFDLIHPGHVRLLSEARAACDRLIVALNTDASVKRLKGPTRPLQNEMARATVMASMAPVDLVTLFDEDTPLKLIQRCDRTCWSKAPTIASTRLSAPTSSRAGAAACCLSPCATATAPPARSAG